jgi:hypothetical protein
MNNKLNEIRRKISFLRSEMLRAEDAVRKQVNRNEDCTVASLQVMAMRTALLVLISERNRLGGSERLLDVDEMLTAVRRPVNSRPLQGPRVRRER